MNKRRRRGQLYPLPRAERARRRAYRKRTHRAAKIWEKRTVVKAR